jgi:hypothetical protein
MCLAGENCGVRCGGTQTPTDETQMRRDRGPRTTDHRPRTRDEASEAPPDGRVTVGRRPGLRRGRRTSRERLECARFSAAFADPLPQVVVAPGPAQRQPLGCGRPRPQQRSEERALHPGLASSGGFTLLRPRTGAPRLRARSRAEFGNRCRRPAATFASESAALGLDGSGRFHVAAPVDGRAPIGRMFTRGATQAEVGLEGLGCGRPRPQQRSQERARRLDSTRFGSSRLLRPRTGALR